MDQMQRCLVAGCGRKAKKSFALVGEFSGGRGWEYVNLDCVALPGVDLEYDLDRIGDKSYLSVFTLGNHLCSTRGKLPFPDGTFDRIEAEDVLEHVSNPIAVVEELGRVLKVGGVLWVRGPDYRHGDVVWADLTHKRAFAPRTLDGFVRGTYDERHYGHYHGTVRFEAVERAKEVNKGLEWVLRRL